MRRLYKGERFKVMRLTNIYLVLIIYFMLNNSKCNKLEKKPNKKNNRKIN